MREWLFRRLLRRSLGRQWAVEETQRFFALLKESGYPHPFIGGSLIVHDVPEDRARFLGAVAYAAGQLTRERKAR